MCLSESESRIITHAVTAKDPDAVVYLFGSRADDAAKGGDIVVYPDLSRPFARLAVGVGAFVNANKLALFEEELHNPKKAAD